MISEDDCEVKPRCFSLPSENGPHEGSTPPSHLRSASPHGTCHRRRHDIDGRRSSSCSSPARDDVTRKRKSQAIFKAAESNPPDVTTLRQLAISRGGLLNDELRKIAWPQLLDVDISNIPPKPSTEVLHSHRDYQQVVLDVNRSLKRFPPGMEEEVRMSYQDQLIDCIMRVLVHQPSLHYYQGYHDIVVTFLLVVGEDITFALMDRLSKNHLNDFLAPNMDKTSHILNYLYPIIGKASPMLRGFMEKADVGTIFSLSWLITWYGHVLSDFRHIVRLYDFFIACHPIMPIYLAAATVLYREEEVLRCEPEMPFIHSLLSNMPDDLPFERLCVKAGDLFVQYPPEELAQEAKEHFERTKEENAKKLEAQKAAREAYKARQMAKTQQNTTWWRWMSAYTNKHRGILFHITVCTLAVAVAAATYSVYYGNSAASNYTLVSAR